MLIRGCGTIETLPDYLQKEKYIIKFISTQTLFLFDKNNACASHMRTKA